MSTILNDIYELTVQGNYNEIGGVVQKAVDEGIKIDSIINESLSKAMLYVGDKFGEGELYMPDMLLAAKTMKTAMDILRPLMKGDENLSEKGTLVIGTVKGDLHDIGKNLVITMAEGQGFKVIDLGIDVDYEKFVEAINEHKPDIVAFSGLLTTTLGNIAEHIKTLEDSGLRKQVILAVGGAPVTREFADRYGIEIYAPDASTAAKEFVKALSEKK
ncbi:MAG TPA: cobalamin-binding protein [Actinobacteria bacterium]|jgi:5-methyltetrahydrofolate--homocysteine methyltransferase|nr:cobalamin-binding protein [Actinomycetota bacterium]